mmetsp:Transcript_27039/g.23870  ORF Transcript_27039/g.23870 Transcript_27039/m.23870 type:complete len:301 (-) Transcript_27039:80-982(-)
MEGSSLYNGSIREINIKNQEWEYNFLRSLNLFMALALIILEIFNFSVKNEVQNLYHEIEDLQKNKYVSKNFVYYPHFTVTVIKIMSFLLNSIPYLNIPIEGKMLGGRFNYTLDGIIMIFTLHRLFFCINLYFFMSKWGGAEFKSTMDKHKVDLTYTYLFRLEVKYHPIKITFILSGVLFFYCSVILSYLEKSFTGDFSPDWDKSNNDNNFWLTLVTMTTVGYGDGYPATHLGRLIMLFACICGRFLLSLLYVYFQNTWSHNEYSNKLYHSLKKMRNKDHNLFLKDKKRISVLLKKRGVIQ